MKIAPVAEIKARFSAYLNDCKNEPVIVTRNGKAAAVLLPITDDEELERIMIAYSPGLRAILEEGKQQIRKEGGISHDDFWEKT